MATKRHASEFASRTHHSGRRTFAVSECANPRGGGAHARSLSLPKSLSRQEPDSGNCNDAWGAPTSALTNSKREGIEHVICTRSCEMRSVDMTSCIVCSTAGPMKRSPSAGEREVSDGNEEQNQMRWQIRQREYQELKLTVGRASQNEVKLAVSMPLIGGLRGDKLVV